ASDAMGRYPDNNLAESLQRLPGVSVTRDQGEGRFVVIRGLDSSLNRAVSRVKCNTSRDLLLAQLMDGQPSRPLIVQKLREPVF
ncbi:TonB-dependent receptor, partial [Xanthomonas oryzae pv. oryzae]